ncbi:MAG: glutamate--tRNA ligase [Candidatus Aureabacteria bacterium]|nr:glutamate--tRNA ligase [Candidatus Auribacterota bacterium]
MSEEVRCRIAPSPTGEPHVGTAYIALFNLCYARKYKGKFILRIEDTDQSRSTRESEESIYQSLSWLGLNWDEGPDIGGPFGPYRQSERLSIYHEQIKKLLDSGRAYRCFCTPQELDTLRKYQEQNKRPPGYFGKDSKCRHLNETQIKERLDAKIPHVIRMAVPMEEGKISFYDHIRKEEITRRLNEVDDQIILKSDGFPTYHLASVVDDHLMKITHVIRGEEWINSTYKHVLLYSAFGWEPPKFFHLGLLRNPDSNRTKISKRKNPVSLRWFRAAGYLPQALINFLGLMGYSRYRDDMSDEEKKSCEIFSLQTMINDFNETRISPTGPAFDFAKLEDLNFSYLSQFTDDGFYQYLNDRQTYLKTYFGAYNRLFIERYLRPEKDVSFWSSFLFKHALQYKRDDFEKAECDNAKQGAEILKKFKKLLSREIETLHSADEIKDFINKVCGETGATSKQLHMLLRVAVTGSSESLPLYQSMALLGLYRCLVRCDEAASFLGSIRE